MRLKFAKALLSSILFLYSFYLFSCGMAWRQGDAPAEMKAERTLIVWNAKDKREDFIRSVNFESHSESLGFIVPVPSIPEVADFDSEVFKKLDQEMERQRPKKYLFFPKASYSNDFAADGGGGGGPPGSKSRGGSVSVLAEYELSDYSVKVIRAESIEPLAEWLSTNDFYMRDALKDWLQSYLDKKWAFTVFNLKKKTKDTGFSSKSVRISFQSSEPVYPYRDSSDNVTTMGRSLLLYFLSDTLYAPDFLHSANTQEEASGWARFPLFSNKITLPNRWNEMLKENNSQAWLTVWQDQTFKRPERDLTFSASSQYALPVLLSPQEVDLSSYVILAGLILALFLVGFVLIRVYRKFL